MKHHEQAHESYRSLLENLFGTVPIHVIQKVKTHPSLYTFSQGQPYEVSVTASIATKRYGNLFLDILAALSMFRKKLRNFSNKALRAKKDMGFGV